jgi:predicted Zn-dependent protease
MRYESRVRELLTTAERHTRSGRLRRAVVAYRKVLRLTKADEFQHELAQGRLADLHLALRQADRAVPHLLRARALADEPEPQYAVMLGEALLAAERPVDAAMVLHEVVGVPHYTGRALRTLARASVAQGDRATARHLAALAEAQDPDPVQARRLAQMCADA